MLSLLILSDNLTQLYSELINHPVHPKQQVINISKAIPCSDNHILCICKAFFAVCSISQGALLTDVQLYYIKFDYIVLTSLRGIFSSQPALHGILYSGQIVSLCSCGKS